MYVLNFGPEIIRLRLEREISKEVADSDATRSVASWDAIAQQAGRVDEEKLQDLKEDIDTILVFVSASLVTGLGC